MFTPPIPQSIPRPKGNYRACPLCGMTGSNDRIHYWRGAVPQYVRETCIKCDGDGWLIAPRYYSLPITEWPNNELPS